MLRFRTNGNHYYSRVLIFEHGSLDWTTQNTFRTTNNAIIRPAIRVIIARKQCYPSAPVLEDGRVLFIGLRA